MGRTHVCTACIIAVVAQCLLILISLTDASCASGRGGEEGDSFVACLSYLTIDHASLSGRSTGSLILGVYVPYLVSVPSAKPNIVSIVYPYVERNCLIQVRFRGRTRITGNHLRARQSDSQGNKLGSHRIY